MEAGLITYSNHTNNKANNTYIMIFYIYLINLPFTICIIIWDEIKSFRGKQSEHTESGSLKSSHIVNLREILPLIEINVF